MDKLFEMDLFLIFNLAGNEVLIIAIVILLLFGGKKIPELMKGLGTGVKEFKDAAKGEEKSPSNSKEEENK